MMWIVTCFILAWKIRLSMKFIAFVLSNCKHSTICASCNNLDKTEHNHSSSDIYTRCTKIVELENWSRRWCWILILRWSFYWLMIWMSFPLTAVSLSLQIIREVNTKLPKCIIYIHRHNVHMYNHLILLSYYHTLLFFFFLLRSFNLSHACSSVMASERPPWLPCHTPATFEPTTHYLCHSSYPIDPHL